MFNKNGPRLCSSPNAVIRLSLDTRNSFSENTDYPEEKRDICDQHEFRV